MKVYKKRCRKCKAVTKHVSKESNSDSERFVMGILTTGLSELLVTTTITCTKCKHTVEV